MKNNLRALRNAAGLTLKELSERTQGQYAWQTIAGYETTDKDLSADFLAAMTRALGVTPSEILETSEESLREDSRSAKPSLPYPRYVNVETLIRQIQESAEQLDKVQPFELKFVIGNLAAQIEALEQKINSGSPPDTTQPLRQ